MGHFRAIMWRWRHLLIATLLAAALAITLSATAGSTLSTNNAVATRDLPAGHVLSADDLTTATGSLDVPGLSIEEAQGRTLAVGLRQGSLVQESMFRGHSLSDLAPDNTVVVVVPLASTEDFTPVGSVVDLYSPPSEGETEATIVAENATILAFSPENESIFGQSMSDITSTYLAISESQAKLVLGISARTPMLAVLAR